MGLATILIEDGIELHLDGDKLLVGSSSPLTDEQRSFIRANKLRLIEELRQEIEAGHPLRFLHCAADLDLPLLWEDQVFVNQLLEFRSDNERSQLLSNYRAQWLTAAAAADLKEYQLENTGRHAANTWLRTQLH